MRIWQSLPEDVGILYLYEYYDLENWIPMYCTVYKLQSITIYEHKNVVVWINNFQRLFQWNLSNLRDPSVIPPYNEKAILLCFFYCGSIAWRSLVVRVRFCFICTCRRFTSCRRRHGLRWNSLIKSHGLYAALMNWSFAPFAGACGQCVFVL